MGTEQPQYEIPPPPAPEDVPAGPPDEVVEMIARVCHEANRAYQTALGEEVISDPWDDQDEETRESARDGVRNALQNGALPGQSHENWIKFKTEAGWTWGPKKDFEAKTHPDLVPFDELPEDQKTKDYLFTGIVRALASGTREKIKGAFLVVVDDDGGATGIVNPYDISRYETERFISHGEVWRACTEVAHDIEMGQLVQSTAQATVQATINAQMQIAQQVAAEEQRQRDMHAGAVLLQKGGHLGKGGKPRG